MRKIYTVIVLPLFVLVSCRTPAYYMSPFNATTNYYHAVPMHSDSVKVANYATAVIMGGGQNFLWRDGVAAFHGSFHQARNFGHFQAFYGAGISLGSYHVKNIM